MIHIEYPVMILSNESLYIIPHLNIDVSLTSSLESRILHCFLEILDILNVHRGIQIQLHYDNIETIMLECILWYIEQISNRSITHPETKYIKQTVSNLIYILKNDFLYHNLRKKKHRS